MQTGFRLSLAAVAVLGVSVLSAGGCSEPGASGPGASDQCSKGSDCAPRTGSVSTCADGVCVFTCEPKRADCDGDPLNGCEADLRAVTSCGDCATTCDESELCDASADPVRCTLDCAPDATLCGVACVDTSKDLAHCGGCDQACAFAHATAACNGGRCALESCAADWGDCDDDAATGCETALDVADSCGGCDTVCTTLQACLEKDGTFQCVVVCDPGFGDCDGKPENGCEVSTSSDVNNCGACGNRCSFANASASCDGARCAMGACDAGWTDRDENASNGCEYHCAAQPDDPDDAFDDTNCDGIDGNAARAVFVSPTGNDSNDGRDRAAPKRTIAAAIARVKELGAADYDIYAAGGNYTVTSELQVEARVSIYGGYAPATWVRSDSSPAVITRTGAANASGRLTLLTCSSVNIATVFDRVSLVTENAVAGTSNVAVHVSNCPGLSFNHATIKAGLGGVGASGSNGATGSPGGQGATGGAGSCDEETRQTAGGTGGSGCNFYHGGQGGGGGYSSNNFNGQAGLSGYGPGTGAGGAGGAGGDPGRKGLIGFAGAAGAGGSNGAGGSPGGTGKDGSLGSAGAGGGGGGGGGGQTCSFCNNGSGNGGGGGGGGGCGGNAGTGGKPGGDSIALYIAGGTMAGRVKNCTISALGGGIGGKGGEGGTGGLGGYGGLGGRTCTGEVGEGGYGGTGGKGGSGGHGGGGGGGSCWGIVGPATDQTQLLTDNTITSGSGGAGGTSRGNYGQAGLKGEFKVR